MKKFISYFSFMLLTITCIALTISCVSKSSSNKVNNITNNVTNEITNKVVNYEEFTVEDLQTAVQTAVDRVEPACIGVAIKNVTDVSNYGTSEDAIGYGSGVIYKREEIIENGKLVNYKYYVITNRHVITSDEYTNTKIYVYIQSEDMEIEATILGYDDKVDVACLTFNHSTYIQPIEFGDSDSLDKGTFVVAIGNPGGYDYYGSVTFGVVSAPLRYLQDDTDEDGTYDFNATYIQHDVAINPGNSGGGLFTIDGKLVGINTLKIVQDSVDSMGFSIPSNLVKTLMENYLEKNIKISRPTIGIIGSEVRYLTPAIIDYNGLKPIPDIYEIGERPYGLYVTKLVPNGSVYNSGIKADDIILTIDGVKIKESTQLSAMLNDLTQYTVGTEVTFTYYKRSTGTIESVKVVLK